MNNYGKISLFLSPVPPQRGHTSHHTSQQPRGDWIQRAEPSRAEESNQWDATILGSRVRLLSVQPTAEAGAETYSACLH